MKLIFRYMSKYKWLIVLAMFVKLLATIVELLLPYILEYTIDEVVPLGDLKLVLLCSLLMFAAAVAARFLNVYANRTAISNASRVSYDVRKDLFDNTINLAGDDFDEVGLPSLTSRMTSDSYNVQQGAQQLQTMCVRQPMMLVGGLFLTMIMDFKLSLILVIEVPILLTIVLFVSYKGMPLFDKLQSKLDVVVRQMRESITGIRVVKALGKEDYQTGRFRKANKEMTQSDITASTVMALPSPIMQLLLNMGLVLVVIIGANRVNSGLTKPGVILAFLTYFNMINMGVMGLNRIFLNMSKASASANRIGRIINIDTSLKVYQLNECAQPKEDHYIQFENVDFYYGTKSEISNDREKALDGISFTLERGETLGIIGPTGCGKSTIINLLMRFYDVDGGNVYVDGQNVKNYDKDTLHKKFGVCFQNDIIFKDTLHENINFGRDVDDSEINKAVDTAQAREYVDNLDDGLQHQATIKGANLSGGQKQRIEVARALADNPEILVLDDSSSALDYKTDASMRKAIREQYPDVTMILIAQRVSSVMNSDKIMVLDNGRCIGYGTHKELLESCPSYNEIYKTQMGSLE